jgi:uncharacterized repeat protein (TIGR02543 family)
MPGKGKMMNRNVRTSMMNGKRIYAGAAAVLLVVFAGCDMLTPKALDIAGVEGKAAVRIDIEGSGIEGRTVLPAVGDVADVGVWELWGARKEEDPDAAETLLEDFTGGGTTVYLDPGTWDFTLKGYNEGEDGEKKPVLRGTLTEQPIAYEGPNTLSFTVEPLTEEAGAFSLTVELPEGHGITTVKIYRNGELVDAGDTPGITTDSDGKAVIIYKNDDCEAGDYYFSIRLYKSHDGQDDLYGVVSEVVQVRSNLESKKNYPLELTDLNLMYEITYHLNGGSLPDGVENPGYYRSTDAVITLPAPVRTGYTFDAWYINAPYTPENKAETIAQGSTGNKDFYAGWTTNTYRVAYNANGGEGTMGQSSHTYDLAQNLSANLFTWLGYAFNGWNTQADGGGASYTGGQSVTNLSSVNGGVVNLHARWSPVTYTITYDLDGGTNHADNPSSYTIESSAITLKDPVRSGYGFAGWYTSSDFAAASWAEGISAGSTGKKEFYALWKPGVDVSMTLRPRAEDPGLSDVALFVNGSITFYALGDGYTSYAWYWDGDLVNGPNSSSNSYTLPNTLKTAGIHELSVRVTAGNGDKLSARCRVTIKAN